jgi:hypothetical protein
LATILSDDGFRQIINDTSSLISKISTVSEDRTTKHLPNKKVKGVALKWRNPVDTNLTK